MNKNLKKTMNEINKTFKIKNNIKIILEKKLNNYNYMVAIKINLPHKEKNIEEYSNYIMEKIRVSLELLDFSYLVFNNRNFEIRIILGFRLLYAENLNFLLNRLKVNFCLFLNDFELTILENREKLIEFLVFFFKEDLQNYRVVSYLQDSDLEVLYDLSQDFLKGKRYPKLVKTDDSNIRERKYFFQEYILPFKINRENLLIIFINKYLFDNDLVVYKNILLKKIESSHSSWLYFSDIKYLIGNIRKILFNEKSDMRFQLEYLNVLETLNNIYFEEIKELKSRVANLEEISDAIEFKDGYYFLDSGSFIKKGVKQRSYNCGMFLNQEFNKFFQDNCFFFSSEEFNDYRCMNYSITTNNITFSSSSKKEKSLEVIVGSFNKILEEREVSNTEDNLVSLKFICYNQRKEFFELTRTKLFFDYFFNKKKKYENSE